MTTKVLTPYDMGANKIIHVGNGSASDDVPALGQVALLTGATFTGPVSVNSTAINDAQPADLGYLGWSFDPAILAGTSGSVLGTGGTAGAGVLQLIKIPLYGQSLSTAGLRMLLAAVGVSLTSGQNFAYLYKSDGTFVAATADQATAWTTGGNVGKTIDMPWASGPFTITGQFCWAALVYNGTTGPSFTKSGNITAAMANGKLSAANSRFGSILSGVTTATPGNFTPSSITQLAAEFWAAIY